jgi:uncharacterized RDD family membrane protein YckC
MATQIFVSVMKISDLQNYEIPTESEKHKIQIFKQKTKLPFFAKIKQTFIDFTICNLVRIILGIALFKFFARNLPTDVATKLMNAENNREFLIIIVTNKIHVSIIMAFILSFCLGSLYYIFMNAYSSFGTLGMKFANLQIQTKRGNKPTILQTFLWYYLKILYPVFLILAILIFLTKGMTGGFWIIGLLAVLFSETFPIVFGTQPLYEKISGVKITMKK